MPLASQRPKRTVAQPGRLAAIGGAAVVCLLAVSGALGMSPSGGGADEAGSRDAALETSSGSADDGASSSTGGSSVDETPRTTAGPGGSGTGETQTGGTQTGETQTGDTQTGETQTGETQTGDTQTGNTSGGTTGSVDTSLPKSSGTGRRVVFDMTRQRVWLVAADGTVARTYPVSGSKFHNLDAGTYSVSSRDATATAYNSTETMRYMVRFASGRTAPIGFHSIPAFPNGSLAETRAQLGTPQSDGCIRQWITDARAMWSFAPIGTKVVVLA